MFFFSSLIFTLGFSPHLNGIDSFAVFSVCVWLCLLPPLSCPNSGQDCQLPCPCEKGAFLDSALSALIEGGKNRQHFSGLLSFSLRQSMGGRVVTQLGKVCKSPFEVCLDVSNFCPRFVQDLKLERGQLPLRTTPGTSDFP